MENSISNFKRFLNFNGCIPKKFSRSYPCLGKKDSKHKNNLTLINESSEEEEIHSKSVVLINGNGVKKSVQGQDKSENDKHQGHYRQLSRDRQLPPVPDTGDFVMIQANSLRKSSFKQNKSNDSFQKTKEQPKPTTEDYGSIAESETYGDSRMNTQFSINNQPGPFKTGISDEIKDVDPLYASVLPHAKRSEIHEKSIIPQNFDHDDFLINNLNDHGYSTIMKKSSINEFSSLRKPDRSKSSAKDYGRQSLQSLNNPAPGVPIRQYKLSELFHLKNGERPLEHDVKIREHCSSYTSNSVRRFSQPLSLSKERNTSSYIEDSNKQDQDILMNLQSTYNTPPVKRASLSNLCKINCIDSSTNLNDSVLIPDQNEISNENIPEQKETTDFYRRITVRESLASLRARNALPEDTSFLNYQPTSTAVPNLHHVYEGFYETLYYSSADNGKNAPAAETERTHQPVLQQPPNPLPYLGQDNYLSITENPLSVNFPNESTSLTQNVSMIRSSNDRSSVVYAPAGSDVYAEISDIYQSKQYEELPEMKQILKSDGGQVNNGFIGCSSPGSVRVLLEIQSFRHMDSDVDISSRCTTPLHSNGKSIATYNKPVSWKNSCASDLDTSIIRHPWYLPQKSVLNTQLTSARSLTGPTLNNKPPISKPKTPQNNLAIMTPLMERSMEGSSMFLDENKNCQSAIDSLYDLFKHDKSNNVSQLTVESHLPIAQQFLSQDSSPDENSFSIKTNSKRIIYPRYSGSDYQ